MRDESCIGVMALTRQTPQPFATNQIELATTFADQAVIAIENVRLFEAEQAGTRELTEFLEQQTATFEVLRVILSSPGGLEPVFETLLTNATRICEARSALCFSTNEADCISPRGTMCRRRSKRCAGAVCSILPGYPIGDVIRTKQTAHAADLAATERYLERHPATVSAVELGGVRTVVAVPMLKDDELIGVDRHLPPGVCPSPTSRSRWLLISPIRP